MIKSTYELTDIENCAIIESMKEEIDILLLKHKLAIMIRQKILLEMQLTNVGEALYERYGLAYMNVCYNCNKIHSPKETFNFPLKIYRGGGVIIKPLQKTASKIT